MAPTSGMGSPGGPTTPQAQTGTSGAPAGGQFASLQNYLSANQGQAQPLAENLSKPIAQEYKNLDTANNAAIASIGKQVENAPGYTPSNAAVMSNEAANPVSFASNPGNVQQFQSLLKNTYSGPVSAESTADYANRQNAVNQAIATGTANTTTEAGRKNLLSQNEARPTSSVTALNSAILSQDPNALATVESAYKPFGNLLTNLQTGAQGVNQTISKEQADAAASSKAANDAIAKQISDLNAGVTGRLTAAQQAAQAQNARLRQNFQRGNLSDQDLQSIGLTRDQFNNLTAAQKAAATSQVVQSASGQTQANTGTTNVDLSNFLTQTDPNAVLNAANVATPEDYARAQAFQTLLNGMNLQTPTAIINPAASSQAGTAPKTFSQYDYQTALNTANAAKADEVAAAQAYVDALQAGADEKHAQLAAQDAGKKSMEQKLLAGANTAVGLPVAVAAQLPVIGAPIARAVDTVTSAIGNATWICTAMRKAGVMTQEEIDLLHDHLYRAAIFKPWTFIKYFVLGKPLVFLCGIVSIEWRPWKLLFYDMVMAERNPIKAVEMYERYFWELAETAWHRFRRT